MKKIEDYLHLYLGCEFVLKIRDTENISAPMHFGVEALMAAFASQKSGDKIFPLLLLRPLDTMTEEEAIEVAKLSEWEPHFRDVKAEKNKYNDWIVTWQGANESREIVNATGDCFYCAEQFQWLLKNGFDLFDLIESGLALGSKEREEF